MVVVDWLKVGNGQIEIAVSDRGSNGARLISKSGGKQTNTSGNASTQMTNSSMDCSKSEESEWY